MLRIIVEPSCLLLNIKFVSVCCQVCCQVASVTSFVCSNWKTFVEIDCRSRPRLHHHRCPENLADSETNGCIGYSRDWTDHAWDLFATVDWVCHDWIPRPKTLDPDTAAVLTAVAACCWSLHIDWQATWAVDPYKYLFKTNLH